MRLRLPPVLRVSDETRPGTPAGSNCVGTPARMSAGAVREASATLHHRCWRGVGEPSAGGGAVDERVRRRVFVQGGTPTFEPGTGAWLRRSYAAAIQPKRSLSPCRQAVLKVAVVDDHEVGPLGLSIRPRRCCRRGPGRRGCATCPDQLTSGKAWKSAVPLPSMSMGMLVNAETGRSTGDITLRQLRVTAPGAPFCRTVKREGTRTGPPRALRIQ